MRKSPQIIVDCSKLTEGFDEPTETIFIMGRGDKSGVTRYSQQVGRGVRRPPHVYWWNRQLGPYYTVGHSLGCLAVFLIILAAMIWAMS